MRVRSEFSARLSAAKAAQASAPRALGGLQAEQAFLAGNKSG